MKVGHPFFVARSDEKSTSYSFGATTWPSVPTTVTPLAATTTIWSCSISTARLVCSTKASASEPRKFSPSPRPTTRGDERRAATIAFGDSVETTSRVKVPSSCSVTARMATTSRRATSASAPVRPAVPPWYEAGDAPS
jgi:hypothetical protein